MMIPKQNRERKPKHRKWIATLPCCVSGIEGQTQAAHVSKGRYSLGMKAGDNFIIPLSVEEHRTQTLWPYGEAGYWEQHGGIDKVKKLANDLYEVSGNTEAAYQLLGAFR
jgi:hypothetical protein